MATATKNTSKAATVKFLSLTDIRGKKPAELDAYITELKNASKQLQMDLSTNKTKATHVVSKLKRAIAQVKTVQTQMKQKEEA